MKSVKWRFYSLASPLNPLSRIRIVLCRTWHPGNIGATARAMKTMGLSDLRLVAPTRFPDPEADTLSAGATDILEQATITDTLAEALSGCHLAIGMSARPRELSHPAIGPREAAAMAIAEPRDIALVFGNETYGLSNEELMLCQQLVHIPANPAFSSLNLAAAVQIMAYEVRTALHQTPSPMTSQNPYRQSKPATLDEIESYFTHLEATLTTIGFFDKAHPKRLMQRLRRLYARAALQQEEVNILRGILSATTRHKSRTTGDSE